MPNKNEFELVSESALSKLATGARISDDEAMALSVRFPHLLECIAETEDVPRNPQELISQAMKAEKVISKIENGVEALRNKVAAVTSDPLVISPFNRIERNKNNPLRNKYELHMAYLRQTLPQYGIPENSFFYVLAGEEKGKQYVAAFRNGVRTLVAPDNFSEESEIDSIVVCHEAVHVLQDDTDRSNITSIADARQYHNEIKFLGEGERIIINRELPAYGRELKIIDCLLGGALQHPDNLDKQEIMEKLGASRPEQQIIVETLIGFAKVFPGFAQHQPHEIFPNSFSDKVIELCNHWGYEVFAKDATSGRLQPIK